MAGAPVCRADILWTMGELESDGLAAIDAVRPVFVNHFVNEVLVRRL